MRYKPSGTTPTLMWQKSQIRSIICYLRAIITMCLLRVIAFRSNALEKAARTENQMEQRQTYENRHILCALDNIGYYDTCLCSMPH